MAGRRRAELSRILGQADDSADREAWFGKRKPGASWNKSGMCVPLPCLTLEAVIRELIGRTANMPDVATLKDLHQGRKGAAIDNARTQRSNVEGWFPV